MRGFYSKTILPGWTQHRGVFLFCSSLGGGEREGGEGAAAHLLPGTSSLTANRPNMSGRSCAIPKNQLLTVVFWSTQLTSKLSSVDFPVLVKHPDDTVFHVLQEGQQAGVVHC